MKLYRNPLALAVLTTLAFASAPILRAAQAPASKPVFLTSRIAALEKAIEDLKLLRAIDQTAYRNKLLDCTSQASGEIQTSHGNLIFFATCAGIEPHMEGYKVTVHIGNPYVTEFSNTSLKLYHGKDVEETIQKDRHVKVDLPYPLTSGAWTPVVFIIKQARAEDLRYTSLQMDVGVVRLLPPKPGP